MQSLPPARRLGKRTRPALVCALFLYCGGCQWLQNEFTTVVVPPPSARAGDAPALQPW